MLLTLLAIHGTAFAALLLLSRHDVMRVDETGRSLDQASSWVAGRVPAAAEDVVPA